MPGDSIRNGTVWGYLLCLASFGVLSLHIILPGLHNPYLSLVLSGGLLIFLALAFLLHVRTYLSIARQSNSVFLLWSTKALLIISGFFSLATIIDLMLVSFGSEMALFTAFLGLLVLLQILTSTAFALAVLICFRQDNALVTLSAALVGFSITSVWWPLIGLVAPLFSVSFLKTVHNRQSLQ